MSFFGFSSYPGWSKEIDDSEVLGRNRKQCPCTFYRCLPENPGTQRRKTKRRGLLSRPAALSTTDEVLSTTKAYFLTDPEAESLRSGCWQGWPLLRSLSLTCRRLSSPCVLKHERPGVTPLPTPTPVPWDQGPPRSRHLSFTTPLKTPSPPRVTLGVRASPYEVRGMQLSPYRGESGEKPLS